jgi:hypothetical protein
MLFLTTAPSNYHCTCQMNTWHALLKACCHKPSSCHVPCRLPYLSHALTSLPSAECGHMPITGKPKTQVHPLHSVSRQLPGTCLPAVNRHQHNDALQHKCASSWPSCCQHGIRKCSALAGTQLWQKRQVTFASSKLFYIADHAVSLRCKCSKHRGTLCSRCLDNVNG